MAASLSNEDWHSELVLELISESTKEILSTLVYSRAQVVRVGERMADVRKLRFNGIYVESDHGGGVWATSQGGLAGEGEGGGEGEGQGEAAPSEGGESSDSRDLTEPEHPNESGDVGSSSDGAQSSASSEIVPVSSSADYVTSANAASAADFDPASTPASTPASASVSASASASASAPIHDPLMSSSTYSNLSRSSKVLSLLSERDSLLSSLESVKSSIESEEEALHSSIKSCRYYMSSLSIIDTECKNLEKSIEDILKMKSALNHLLAARRESLVPDLMKIYPIMRHPTLPNTYTISGFQLSKPYKDSEEPHASAALGHAAELVKTLSHYNGIPLKYRM